MFKDKLVEWRECEGLDRNALAAILDISYQMVSYLENGKNEPSVKILKKLSSYSGISIDEFLKDDDNFNGNKIKEIALKQKYTYYELADDILASREELRKIIEENAEPSQEVIYLICQKYEIPIVEFKSPVEKELETFIRDKENREYLNLAMYAKKNGCSPEVLKNCIQMVTNLKNNL